MSDFRVEGLFDFNKTTLKFFPISDKALVFANENVCPCCVSFTMRKTSGIVLYEELKGFGYAIEEV